MNRPDEDTAWKDIVDSYGDRPEFPEFPPEPAPRAEWPEPEPEPFELEATWEDEGHFVPPEPPPLPRPRGLRALAWAGVFGMPALMILLVIVRWSPPSPVGLIMIVWFIGAFGYLVATMDGPRDPDDDWDNGAVL